MSAFGVRRAQLTAVTGLTADLVNSLARRDQFPFLRLDEATRGWGRYSGTVVFKTVLALALANAGSTQYEAGHFIDREFAILQKVGAKGRRGRPAGDVYFGYAKLVDLRHDPEVGRYVGVSTSEPLCGELGEVVGQVQAIPRRLPNWPIDGVVIVNASQQLRSLARRCDEQQVGRALIDEIGLPGLVSQERL